MEKFKPSNIKGAIDTLPGEQALRNRVISTLKKHFEGFGYVPIETAAVNYLETLCYKYEEGAEIVREIYKIKDQGDRDLGLRFDLTVPFAKFIATNRNLKMPFRRYEIGKVWRNGPVKAGRLREFYQCDIDVVGTTGQAIEAEMIALAVQAYLELGITPVVKYGHRKLLYQLIADARIENIHAEKVVGIIDKMEKVSREALLLELGKFMTHAQAETLLSSFQGPQKNQEIHNLEKKLEEFGVSKYCMFTPNLARGLNVYTGTVWEVFDKKNKVTSSLGGGGRYDNIITQWIDNGLQYPAVGMSFGLEPIMTILEAGTTHPPAIDLMIVSINADLHAFEISSNLRNVGARVLTHFSMPPKKAMEYAHSENIPFVCIIGEKEINQQQVTIRNMQTGKEKTYSIHDIANIMLALG